MNSQNIYIQFEISITYLYYEPIKPTHTVRKVVLT